MIHARIERLRSHAAAQAARGWILAAALAAVGASAVYAASQELGFSRSVTPGLIARFVAQFGSGARARLAGWQDFVRASPPQNAAVDLKLLGSVNRFFNGLPFVTDLAHWGVPDYWATPAEALASDGADCEDYSIAKYFTLKELGVPIRNLRITYVKALRLNEAHMVLAYYPTPDAVPFILDNLDDRVRPATERDDLVPVYSFNDDDVMLVRAGQAANAGSSSQIRQWRNVLDKLQKELLL